MNAPVIFRQGQGAVSADNLNTFSQVITNVPALREGPGAENQAIILEGVATTGDGGQGVFVWSPNSTAADDGINVVVPTGQFPGAWIRLGDLGNNAAITIIPAGYTGAAIQVAVNSGKAYSQYFGGAVEIYLPGHVYTDVAVDLSNCHGLQIRGAGRQGTELRGVGDSPVFTLTGTAARALQSVTLRDMLINGSWALDNANTHGHGIQATFTNGCLYDNIKFYGCNHAIDLSFVFQDTLSNCVVTGSGDIQNNVGLWMNETNSVSHDNALICSNLYVDQTALYGNRIINGQGSKFVNCEAAGTGSFCWYIGDPTTGTYQVEFLHFDNCLADSCPTHGWYFVAGAATALQDIQLSNCWSGNHGGYGFWVEAGNNVILSGIQAHGNNNGAVELLQSSKCVVSGWIAEGNNKANDPLVGDITLAGGSLHTITGGKSNPLHGKCLIEATATNSNLVYGNQFITGGVTRIGVDSSFYGNRGIMNNAVTYNPGTIAAGAVGATQSDVLLGAIVGDDITITFSNALLGVAAVGWVDTPDNVKWRFNNPAGGSSYVGASGTARLSASANRG